MDKIKSAAIMFILVFMVSPGGAFAKEPIFSDDFKKEKLNEKWEWITPVEGPEYTIDTKRGVFIFSVPGGQAFDHWSHIASAPQLSIKCPKGDWTFEAKLKLAESTTGEMFHAVLFVKFADLDYYYWGLYMGTKLQLERSGTNNILSINYDSDEVWLQIKKENSIYHWSYRADEKDKWEELGTAAEESEPERIGLMIKTWRGTEVKVEFSNVKIY